MADFTVTQAIAQVAGRTVPSLAERAERASNWRNDNVAIPFNELRDLATLDALEAAAVELGDKQFATSLSAIKAALSGAHGKIPRFAAAAAMMKSYLADGAVDMWLYKRNQSGHLDAELVTDVHVQPARQPNEKDRLVVSLASQGSRESLSMSRSSIWFEPADLTRRTAAEALLSQGYMKETPELRAEYDAGVAGYRDVLAEGFTQQYLLNGAPLRDGGSWSSSRGAPVQGHKVVHRAGPGSYNVGSGETLSKIGADDDDDGVTRTLPVFPSLPVFNLTVQRDQWVDQRDLTAYEYRPQLREEMILPSDQRELLDILTSDVDLFTNDIIEGKSSGNLILAKGIPGVGKTLTAEVYSEVMQRPLYSIHSGTLGTSADTIRQNLEAAFARAQNLNLVMLIDEADVFVLRRSDNIEQNAIVAEFLRTLEYFEGLLFMTTNRPDDVDDAILSRCAAIIDYRPPQGDDAAAVWRVLAAANGEELSDELVEQLLAAFPTIAPRDMKMLLRLVFRVCASRGVKPSIEAFAQCAMFRGLHAEGVNAS